MKKEYRNAARTRRMIRSAFAELLGEKKTLEELTVAELAERADIAKSTFYNHYTDLYAVAEEYENELLARLSDGIEKASMDSTADFDAYIRSILMFLQAHEETYRHAIASPDTKFFIEKLKSVIARQLLEKGDAFHLSADQSERHVQIRFLTNACVDTICDYYRGTLNAPFDTVGETLIKLIKRLSLAGAKTDG